MRFRSKQRLGLFARSVDLLAIIVVKRVLLF